MPIKLAHILNFKLYLQKFIRDLKRWLKTIREKLHHASGVIIPYLSQLTIILNWWSSLSHNTSTQSSREHEVQIGCHLGLGKIEFRPKKGWPKRVMSRVEPWVTGWPMYFTQRKKEWSYHLYLLLIQIRE